MSIKSHIISTYQLFEYWFSEPGANNKKYKNWIKTNITEENLEDKALQYVKLMASVFPR